MTRNVTAAFVLVASAIGCTTFDGLKADEALSADGSNGGGPGGGGTTTKPGTTTNTNGTPLPNTPAAHCGDTPDKCADGAACRGAEDCTSLVCTSGACVAPSPSDGVKNGSESDVDCGGVTADKCATNKACVADRDCASNACSYAKKCVAVPSCAGHAGGDTCGAGEMDEAGRKHESCCTSLPLPSGNTLDKFIITAGRMRTFLEKVKNNPRAWVEKEKPKTWPDGYPTSALPENEDGVVQELSYLEVDGYTPRGCFIQGTGARTYFLSKETNANIGDDPQMYPQEVYDSKALNCVRRVMATALCAYDGKELATSADILEAWGPAKFPWGDADWNENLAVHQYTYQWPAPIAGHENEQVYHIASPGRRPAGNGPFGHSDVAGLLYAVTKDASVVTGSFEMHGITKTPNPWNENTKYWAGGFRCATHKK